MSVRTDPEGNELDRLLAFAGELAGKSVLEVGCGNGRLTRRYAPFADRIIGIDPDPQRIAQANGSVPPDLRDRLTFHTAGIETFAPDERFDLVLLSWSL